MPKQNRVVEAKPDRKTQVEPVVVEERTEALASLAQRPGGPIAVAGDGAVEAQGARLNLVYAH